MPDVGFARSRVADRHLFEKHHLGAAGLVNLDRLGHSWFFPFGSCTQRRDAAGGE